MKKTISILVTICLFRLVNAQTYRQLFDKHDLIFRDQDYSFCTQLVNSRVESNAAIMEAYLNM